MHFHFASHLGLESSANIKKSRGLFRIMFRQSNEKSQYLNRDIPVIERPQKGKLLPNRNRRSQDSIWKQPDVTINKLSSGFSFAKKRRNCCPGLRQINRGVRIDLDAGELFCERRAG